MRKWKRNEGMHTQQVDAEGRILYLLSGGPQAMPSVLGYAAFPAYKFNRPQGAAFAVAKILSVMCEKKLIRRERRGYSITDAGCAALAKFSGKENETGHRWNE